MNRRNFIALAAAIPFGGIALGKPSLECPTELMPHRLVMPGLTWPTVAFVGQVTNGVVVFNGIVTDAEAKKLSTAINKEWHELRQWFQLCLGVDHDHIAEQWLLGDGWQRRVRIAEAFFRGGGFRIVPQSDDVLLLRTSLSLLDSPQVVEFSKDGLRLDNGSVLVWPEEESGVLRLVDSQGKVVGSWWPGEVAYDSLVEVFRDFPGRLDIVAKPWRRVVRFQ